MTTPTTTPTITADTLIIVAGQQFAIGVASDIETVRQQLVGMGFADVANAEPKRGTSAEGKPTLEFVKKAGTKGISGSDILAHLVRVPAAVQPMEPYQQVQRLLRGGYTFDEALTQPVSEAISTVLRQTSYRNGDSLCNTLAGLPAVASDTPNAW